jgi:DNA modification methylase
MSDYQLFHGDCLEVMAGMEAGSVDAVITDPPYELGFMGKAWDNSGIAYNVDVWRECLRVLKPGGHLLAFGGSRTYHRLACAVEDAGFEIRDQIMWVYGSGFPKSLNVGKAIDAKIMTGRSNSVALSESEKNRPVVGEVKRVVSKGRTASSGSGDHGVPANMERFHNYEQSMIPITAPATPEAQQWDGWGTALKPSHEPLVLCRKPFTIVPFRDIIVAETQTFIGGLLCLLLSDANNVEAISRLSHPEPSGASVSALLIAAVLRGKISGDLSEKMGMCNSPETVRICLNIVESWSGILDVICSRANTFTISTATGLTTALKTLNCLLSEIIPESITRAVSLPPGSQSPVQDAGLNLNGERKSTNYTQNAFAAALATLQKSAEFISAKNAVESLLPTTRAVDIVLSHALQQLTTESEEKIRPAHEPIVVARKPLAERTVAANVLEWGTGAINVDGCRVGHDEPLGPSAHGMAGKQAGIMGKTVLRHRDNTGPAPQGRWPANLILSYPEDEYDAEGNLLPNPGKDEVLAGFPVTTSGALNAGHKQGAGSFGKIGGETILRDYGGDTGSAARFFYVAKSSKRDRNEGCEGLEEKGKVFNGQSAQPAGNAAGSVEDKFSTQPAKNFHPCVKPTALMQYLCRLITPPGGLVLDPFMGSGSTGKGAILEGFRFIGIEQDAEYIEIARRRIEWAFQQAHPTTGEFVTKAGRAEDTDGLPMFGGEQ